MHTNVCKISCKETDSWPNVDKKILDNIKINLVVQINGKTRDVLSIKKNLTELEINKLIQSNSKAKKISRGQKNY